MMMMLLNYPLSLNSDPAPEKHRYSHVLLWQNTNCTLQDLTKDAWFFLKRLCVNVGSWELTQSVAYVQTYLGLLKHELCSVIESMLHHLFPRWGECGTSKYIIESLLKKLLPGYVALQSFDYIENYVDDVCKSEKNYVEIVIASVISMPC